MQRTSFLTLEMLKKHVKIIFIISMLVLNINYVALPTIQKYLDQSIMIEVSTISPERLAAPAVTFITKGLTNPGG